MAEIVYSLKLFTVIELIDGHNERGFWLQNLFG